MARVDDLRGMAEAAQQECVIWPFSKSAGGYGRLRAGKRSSGVRRDNIRHAHRLVCEWWHGPQPEGAEVCHSCDTPACVNPNHLRWDSHSSNCVDREERRGPRQRSNGRYI